MTPQDLVIAAMWFAGTAGAVIGAVGLVYYGVAYLRLARERRKAAHDSQVSAAGRSA